MALPIARIVQCWLSLHPDLPMFQPLWGWNSHQLNNRLVNEQSVYIVLQLLMRDQENEQLHVWGFAGEVRWHEGLKWQVCHARLGGRHPQASKGIQGENDITDGIVAGNSVSIATTTNLVISIFVSCWVACWAAVRVAVEGNTTSQYFSQLLNSLSYMCTLSTSDGTPFKCLNCACAKKIVFLKLWCSHCQSVLIVAVSKLLTFMLSI